ncbi:UNVERIFIED_CONTAM: hypothetical protein GTU68_066761, partial [Idotea baltica]|nr:hypothetical protein [Idotea baltica]
MNKFLLLSLLTLLFITVSAQVTDNERRAVETVVNHFQNVATKIGYSNSDFEQLIITDVYTSKHNNVTHVYLRQQHNGIEVYSANANANVWKDKVLNTGNQFQYNLNRKINNTSPAITAGQAVEFAATHLKLTTKTFKSIEKKNDTAQGEVFSDAGISCDPIPARLVYQPIKEQKTIKLAWEVIIHQLNHEHWWSIRVDAQTGEILDKNDWVVHCSFGGHDDNSCNNHIHQNTLSNQIIVGKSNNKAQAATNATVLANTYNVYPLPIESPSHGARAVVSAPWTAAGLAGTLGWHNDGATNYTIARGNNVYAQEDLNADDVVGYSPDGGATLDFNFPLNLNQAPSNYLDPAITNLFYWNNIMHDIWYQYGFDEVSGNFQNDNQGRGGAQNDYVIADAQDGSATNNANFSTPPDGSTPRMQMFEWSGGTFNFDSDLDNGIICHEYGHGISTRLTGGPSNASCLGNEEQMGEGWSDWLGLMLTLEAGDARNDVRGIGTYVIGQTTVGGGIRPAPYSTDFGVNSYTYAGSNAGVSVPHGVGFVWCTALWEMTWDLIDNYG